MTMMMMMMMMIIVGQFTDHYLFINIDRLVDDLPVTNIETWWHRWFPDPPSSILPPA